MRRSIGFLLLAFVTMVAAGCKSSPPLLQGSITVDPTTNPDQNGRPSVARPAPGRYLFPVARCETDCDPGTRRQLGRMGHSDWQGEVPHRGQAVAVAAAFRDLENSRWRQAVPLPAKGNATVTIGIEARAVTVAVK